MHSPVEQFTIKALLHLELFGFDVSFTNSALFMILAVLISSFYLTWAMRKQEMVPGRVQASAEMLYEFVSEMVKSNVGNEGRPYFPFIFTLFIFPVVRQYAGADPLFLYLHLTDRGDICPCSFHLHRCDAGRPDQHGTHFFSFFVPPGAPKVLIPFLIIIEVISYFVRPVSLSVRLFANMLAGHTMLKVFAGLAVMITGAGGVFAAGSVLPFLALIGLTDLKSWSPDCKPMCSRF